MRHDPMMRVGNAPPPIDSLFALGMHRTNDRETSIEAAKKVSTRAGSGRALALEALRKHPDGLTDEELASITKQYQNSIGKRRTELTQAGLIEDSGLRRLSSRGSMMIVWRIKKEEATQ
jgi:transcription initiation factor IIE alpha subunit